MASFSMLGTIFRVNNTFKLSYFYDTVSKNILF